MTRNISSYQDPVLPTDRHGKDHRLFVRCARMHQDRNLQIACLSMRMPLSSGHRPSRSAVKGRTIEVLVLWVLRPYYKVQVFSSKLLVSCTIIKRKTQDPLIRSDRAINFAQCSMATTPPVQDPVALRLHGINVTADTPREETIGSHLEPADRGRAAWNLLRSAFVFEALLWGSYKRPMSSKRVVDADQAFPSPSASSKNTTPKSLPSRTTHTSP